jgi:hypothetical protein
MSRYTIVFSGIWRARVMWLQIWAKSASCLEILRGVTEEGEVASE